MYKPGIPSLAALTLGSALSLSPLLASAADSEELKAEIEALKAQNKEIMERLDATADMLEGRQGGSATPASGDGHMAGQDVHSVAAAGSMRDRTFGIHGSRGSTIIGGYGEMHYNNWDNKNPGGDDKKEMDFHRFILFMGHEFNDKIRFWSELEVEHAVAGDGAPGEVSIEQAFLEFDLTANMAARAGIMLIPVGFINETHEPPTFYGVERPNVAKYIIPTTWREGGAGLTGRFGQGFGYDVMVHTGLNTSAGDDYAVRPGRTGVAKAPANDLAATARLNWTGVPGLLLGAAVQYQSDVTQGNDSQAGSATLLSAHVSWQISKFTLRGVYADWALSGDGPASVGADRQFGWYLEPSWKFNPKVGVFARYSEWDNTANAATDTGYTEAMAGVNYWPMESVVLKFDYQDQSAPTGKDEYDGFSLGIGYMF